MGFLVNEGVKNNLGCDGILQQVIDVDKTVHQISSTIQLSNKEDKALKITTMNQMDRTVSNQQSTPLDNNYANNNNASSVGETTATINDNTFINGLFSYIEDIRPFIY